MFYRSRERPRVFTIGVAEKTLVSDDPGKVAKFVGKRTVYRYDEIVNMCKSKTVLAILFRQAMRLSEPISLAELVTHQVLTGAPQSIVTIRKEFRSWLDDRMGK